MSAVDITFIYSLPLTTTDLYQTRVFDSDCDTWDTECYDGIFNSIAVVAQIYSPLAFAFIITSPLLFIIQYL
jgi:hypothetical protein